ncbi:putative transmembrane protein [Rhodopirellula islandica]|uniref:Transmembrane protein n=1 Tax=Rhodopirellula islandica TaxID=595434 RepID=A0A0J1E8S2_RHOIS|nr:PSD1 and planctomycete cytochrome C domain-containing protein [Rhodopirellula islandica]KLU01869.1 putative transmembrane protein [Rhodopirellula islandica]
MPNLFGLFVLPLFVLLIGSLVPVLLRADEVDFVHDVRPILQQHCYSCHGEEKQRSGLRLDIKSEAFKGGDGWGPFVIEGEPEDSPLIEWVTSEDESSRMPPEGDPLSSSEIATLTNWVEQGADWPDGVDLAVLEDRMDHWSFEPVVMPDMPQVSKADWPRGPLDRMVLARLEQEGLSPSPPADPVVWLRRVTFDLTGLPPTPNEVNDFLGRLEHGEAAFSEVVERLLESPRYGERWAQHWLDVVRYADTHGFEVNTERPNAWPYRDYVIESMNRDTPYDQFIKEQIVGDALGRDRATGFLVTASVLLPGQIGADEPSKRLARQDSLDEIVNNVSQTFLGLSVGCARCHDHKFDPISAKDYYSMQAFVAGVEYKDRELKTPESEALKKQAEIWAKRVTEIEEQLSRFVPIARPRPDDGEPIRTTNARKNTETFEPLEAKFIRFTIHDSNLHPSLGLIAPCIDEFEIYTDEAEPRNVALASLGAQATASGSVESSNHKLIHLNDGVYGNPSSWMSDTNGTGWVMFELPEPIRIGKVVWGRDRLGKLTDRLATSYTLEAGVSEEKLTTLAHLEPRRRSVQATMNTDRITPVRANRLRFTVLATNRLEPCLDELEVFNTEGENIALASMGTSVKTSGDNLVANRHDPRFINDGRHGNASSWMSSEDGKGWVELQFAREQEIERVVWGRDREGKFDDRLATEYLIETALDQDWRRIADSRDRVVWDAGTKPSAEFLLVGLTPDETRVASGLQKEKAHLEKKIRENRKGPSVFAGTFRKPDDIHLLNRGDPEQPKEAVVPAVLSSLGDVQLSAKTPEQERRKALADWIARPDNPLTARVMANRIWQWHFGVGFVDTPNDFGRNGSQPTHPELLDWLALELIRGEWSIKHMHRVIVLSATYRQSTQHNELAAAKDADVRWLWRYPSRRLDGEAIRDSILAINGQLDLKMGGRGFSLFNKRGGLSGFVPVESFQGDGLRRMIYAHKVRRERDAVFGAFDCPDGGQSAARRIESTTPIQALNLFNSPFTMEQAKAFADVLQEQAKDDVSQQVQRAYWVGLNRKPSAEELSDAVSVVREFGLETFCRALFNCNEFLFLP